MTEDNEDIEDDEGGDGPTAERETPPVRRGAVDLRTRDGRTVHHDDAVVRYDPDAFVVSDDGGSGEETRYPKDDLAWIEVRHPRS